MSDADSDDSGKYPVTVATRVSHETSDKLDRYCENNNMGRSVATRQILLDALSPDRYASLVGAALFAAALYTLAWFLDSPAWIGIVGGVFIMYAVLWASYPTLRNWFPN